MIKRGAEKLPALIFGGIMKKITAIIIPALITALLLSACAKKQEKIRVMHWGDVIEMGNVNTIIKDIKKTKGIDVIQERAPAGNSYMEKILTQAAAGMAPDIVFVEVSNFKDLYDRGLLLDLGPFMEKDAAKELDLKAYYPEIVDRFTIDNKLYVIPRDIAPICVIYYNKKVFNDAGIKYPKDNWNWAEFLDTATKLVKKEGNKITRYGFLDEWTIWDAWVYSNGGALVDNVKKPTKCVLDSPEAIEGMQFRADLSYKYKVAPEPSVVAQSSQGWYGTAGMFVNGQVGMFYTGYWKSSFFRQQQDLDWDIVMFPKGPKGKRAFPTGGSGYAITSQCKNPAAAWEVLKKLAGEEGQKVLASQGGLQPAIIKLAESKQFMDDNKPVNKKIMLEAVKYIVFSPLLKTWDEINIAQLGPVLDDVWSGKSTAEKAMKKIVPKINKEFFPVKKEEKK